MTYRLLLIIAVTCLFVMGLVMIFNTTSAEVLDNALNKNPHQALFKQILYGICSCILGYLAWSVGYSTLLRLTPPLLAFFTFLLLLTFAPGIGREVNGSHRWIGIAGYTFQPSEFVKYLIPAYFIHRILSFQGEVFAFKDFLRLMAVIAVPVFLILIEPNNGTVGVIIALLIALFILMKIRFKYWALPLLAFGTVASLSAYHLPYVHARLKVYWNPELDLKGKGHQPHQAKIAAGSGQLFGKGPGNSLQKLSYLPEAQNDYIAAIFAEEFGFIGMSILILLYMVIAYLGFHIANNAKDKEGFYLAASITFLVCFQAFLNLGVVSGLLPSTGLNLPFFSQGGSSLIANSAGIALLLQIDD